MKRPLTNLFLCALGFSLAAVAWFGISTAFAEDAQPTTSATYMIGGLHCPPCTRTVESSLGRTKGIKSAKVDWASKSAKVQFDENVISATQVAQAVAQTPHMMGGGMKYSGTLVMSVPEIRDKDTAKTAADALEKISGVAKVNAFPASHTLTVQFKEGAALTSSQLIEALNKVGMTAKTY